MNSWNVWIAPQASPASQFGTPGASRSSNKWSKSKTAKKIMSMKECTSIVDGLKLIYFTKVISISSPHIGFLVLDGEGLWPKVQHYLILLAMPSPSRLQSTGKLQVFRGMSSLLQCVSCAQIRPLEETYKFGDFFSSYLNESDFHAKPSVLLLGQYSTGEPPATPFHIT